MGRRSVLERVLVEGADDGGYYIVVYDFEVGGGGKIPTRFYRNLSRLEERFVGRIYRVQKSVYVCRGKNVAVTVSRLVRHYGGRAFVFRLADDRVVT